MQDDIGKNIVDASCSELAGHGWSNTGAVQCGQESAKSLLIVFVDDFKLAGGLLILIQIQMKPRHVSFMMTIISQTNVIVNQYLKLAKTVFLVNYTKTLNILKILERKRLPI